MTDGEVSVLMGTKDPDLVWLSQTLRSLESQTVKPKEVIIVDSSDEPFEVDYDRVRIIREDVGLGKARKIGLRNASTKYVMHIDEDAVLSPDYIERGINNLKEPGVSGVGGVVYPIDGTATGSVLAAVDKLSPSSLSTRYIMHERVLCPHGESCISFEDRNEDISIRRHIKDFGELVRDPEMVALKKLPTKRQELALNMIAIRGALGAIEKAVTGSLG